MCDYCWTSELAAEHDRRDGIAPAPPPPRESGPRDPATGWPCRSFAPPFTCYTTPRPPSEICAGCGDAFPQSGPTAREAVARLAFDAIDTTLRAVESCIERDEFPQPSHVPLRADNGYLSATTHRMRLREIRGHVLFGGGQVAASEVSGS